MNNLKKRLERVITKYNKIVIGYSGGVDSTLLTYIASEFRPVLAITLDGPMIPRAEINEAKEYIKDLENVEHLIIPINTLDIEGFRLNPPDRCYHCKSILFSIIKEKALENGCDVVFDGTNIDDFGDYRPGLKAIEELNIVSPFVLAELSKADIYDLSKSYDLPTQNKPSFACLASRIPQNEEITKEKLEKIEKIEGLLKNLGFKQYRFRYLNDSEALIECYKEDFDLYNKNKDLINSEVDKLGLKLIDSPREYKTGSMNVQKP